jgi:Mn2+/Fe2+ NRAMP family transporter
MCKGRREFCYLILYSAMCFSVFFILSLHCIIMIMTRMVNPKSLNVLRVFGVLCVVGFNMSFVSRVCSF